jgi:hypothetical protein
MKKLFLSLVAGTFALAAAAQNSAIDALAEKYTDREGFTVVNLDGEALKSMGQMLANSGGNVNLGEDAPDVEMGELIKDLASLTVLLLDRADEAFASEVRSAVSAKSYSPMVSLTKEGYNIKVLTADIKRGKLRGKQELVVTMNGDDKVILVRLIGKFDPETLSKITSSMNKS